MTTVVVEELSFVRACRVAEDRGHILIWDTPVDLREK